MLSIVTHNLLSDGAVAIAVPSWSAVQVTALYIMRDPLRIMYPRYSQGYCKSPLRRVFLCLGCMVLPILPDRELARRHTTFDLSFCNKLRQIGCRWSQRSYRQTCAIYLLHHQAQC